MKSMSIFALGITLISAICVFPGTVYGMKWMRVDHPAYGTKVIKAIEEVQFAGQDQKVGSGIFRMIKNYCWPSAGQCVAHDFYDLEERYEWLDKEYVKLEVQFKDWLSKEKILIARCEQLNKIDKAELKSNAAVQEHWAQEVQQAYAEYARELTVFNKKFFKKMVALSERNIGIRWFRRFLCLSEQERAVCIGTIDGGREKVLQVVKKVQSVGLCVKNVVPFEGLLKLQSLSSSMMTIAEECLGVESKIYKSLDLEMNWQSIKSNVVFIWCVICE